ncbi:MAG TPA: hypothetical protein ENI95_00165, partial [Chloroflexi bacterium]|nr:hypothetical protein [Chloroflexota bacterium]
MWLTLLAGLLSLSCNLSRALSAATPAPDPAHTPTVTSAPPETPSDAASPAPSPDAETAALVAALARYGVTVAAPETLSPNEVTPVYEAVSRLGEYVLRVGEAGRFTPATPDQAFREVFGPTVVRIYPARDTVDGVFYAAHCGWEGREANACRSTSIYPEQEFPEGAWLILFAGNPLLRSGPEEGVRLAAHELAHNLTRGGGHDPENVGGLNYVRYAGMPYGLEHAQAFGVRVGLYAYATEEARRSHACWQCELTADA